MPAIFINGRFIDDPADASLSAFDAAFQHAVGLFETMLGGVDSAGDTWVLQLDEHIDRLVDSARTLGLSDSLRSGALAEAVVATVKRSGLPRTRVRLTVTGGDLSLLSRGSAAGGPHDPTILIAAQPATRYPESLITRGGTLVIADARANPLNPFEGHKTLNYWWRLRELQRAAAKGGDEAVIFSVSNHVASGCVSNIFLIRSGTLITPIARGEEQQIGGKSALPSPVLPGVTRAWVIDRAESLGLALERRMVAASDILEADEVFVTNSSWGVLPIVRFEANSIGSGTPGPQARALRDLWIGLAPQDENPLP